MPNPVIGVKDSITGRLTSVKGTDEAMHIESQAGSTWAYGTWPHLYYTSSSNTGGATADNTVVYQSASITDYNYHLIENTSATDPVDVFVSLDGTNYATAAASVLLADDVTTGGGIKVIDIPVGKVGILRGKYAKIKVLKKGATAETPACRIAHGID